MSDILIVGPKRPPFGGIEVYGRNLVMGLLANGISVETIDIIPRSRDGAPRLNTLSKAGRFVQTTLMVLRSDAPAVHLLSSSYAALYANLLRALMAHLAGKQVVLSLLGGMAHVVVQGSMLRRLLLRLLFSRVSVTIACNAQIHRAILELCGTSMRCELMSNALPLEVMSQGQIPTMIERFIASHDRCLLCIGGPSQEYGLHTLIMALAVIRANIPGTAACILTRLPMAGAYAVQVDQLIRSLDLKDEVLFVEKVEQVTPLMLRCDLVVRPTLTDGDSMSVREALLLGRPVVASDAAVRPQGCVLFRAGDHEDLASQLICVLKTDQYRSTSDQQELQEEGQENLARIVRLYSELTVRRS
jgi:glycosyltransferase involved in cell wall biosynthesis